MKFSKLRQDEGVAGLTMLLSLVTMLFVIGLLVFIFALMGGEIKDTDGLKASESVSGAVDTSLTFSLGKLTLTDCGASVEGAITSITSFYNESVLVNSGNYTYSGCVVDFSDNEYNTTMDNVTYSYTYAGTGWGVANDTIGSISNVTDWYDIFVVIGAMVILILLTVIIITAVRGSGLMAGGSTSGSTSGSA